MRHILVLLIALLCYHSAVSLPADYESVEVQSEEIDSSGTESIGDDDVQATTGLSIDDTEKATKLSIDDAEKATELQVDDAETTTELPIDSTTVSDPMEDAETRFRELKANFSGKALARFTATETLIENLKTKTGKQLDEVNSLIETEKSELKRQLDSLDATLKDHEGELAALATAHESFLEDIREKLQTLTEPLRTEESNVIEEISELQEDQSLQGIPALEERLEEIREKLMAYTRISNSSIDEAELKHSRRVIDFERKFNKIHLAKLKLLTGGSLEKHNANFVKIYENYSVEKSRIYDNFFVALRKVLLDNFETASTNATERIRKVRNYQWMPYTARQGNYNFPESAVQSGEDFDNTKLYVIRAKNSQGETIIGKYSPQRKEAYISKDDKEVQIDTFDLLLAPKYSWVFEGATSDEYEIEGVTICRVHGVQYTVSRKYEARNPGYVTSEKMCKYSHGGNAQIKDYFEALNIEE